MNALKGLAAALLAAEDSDRNGTLLQPQGYRFNTRTLEEWRELDRQRELKRAARKARKARRRP